MSMPPIFWLDVVALGISIIFSTAQALLVLSLDFKRQFNRFFSLLNMVLATWASVAFLLRISLWLDLGDPRWLAELAAFFYVLATPLIFLFASRYVKKSTHRTDWVSILGVALTICLSPFLFRHQLLTAPYLHDNGSTVVALQTSGWLLAPIPAFYLLGALILFWQGRKQNGNTYLVLSVLAQFAGFLFGGVLAIPFPFLALMNMVSLGILGLGVASQQLFNPLRERNAELQREIDERIVAEEALRQSEEKYRHMLDSLQEGVWVIDQDGNTTYVNPRMAEMLGYTVAEMSGEHLFAFMDEAGAETSKQNMERRASGISEEHDFEFLCKDGARIQTRLATSPIFADGQYVGAIAGVTDITYSSQAEQALQESEERYRALFEKAPDAMFLVDPETCRVIDTNSAAAAMLGRSTEEIIGMDYAQLHPVRRRDDAQEMLDSCTKQLEVDLARPIESLMLGANGEETPVEILTRMVQIQGKPVIQGVCRDITERKKAEQEVTRLAAVIEQASEGVVITDTQGDVTYVNPYFEELTGFSLDEVLGQNPRILRSGYQGQAFYKELWHTITSGETWSGTFTNKRKDGGFYYEAASIFPIKDASGKTINYAAVKRDITERKRRDDAIRRRNRELAILNQVGRELSATLDMNDVIDRLLQSVTEIVGAEGASVWLWEDNDEEWLACRAAVQRGHSTPPTNLRVRSGESIAGWVAQTGESVVANRAPDDPRLFVGIDEQTGFQTSSLLAVPLQTGGRILGVFEVANKLRGDFDADNLALVETLAASAAVAIENARLVETLQQRTVELQARNEELDAYAHTVAHDLNGPLAPLIGYAEVLVMDYKSLMKPSGVDLLRKIARGGRKMSNIINELLLLSTVRKMEDVHIETLDMSRIVNEAHVRLTDLIEEHQAQVQIPDSFPPALGQGLWIEEVWVNYLGNALKYGGRPPVIELGASQQENGSVRYWVRDNGSGLTKDEQARLFTPFTRFDQIRARGHGLGLSIVQRIVEKLGGQVGVESQPDKGSTFWFSLPTAPKS